MSATILWKIRGYLLLAILGTLIVMGGVGFLIDRWFETSPKGLIAGVVLSFPVANFFAIRLAKVKMLRS